MKSQEKLIPFDLQKALEGDSVVTRGGRKVKQITLFDVLYPYRVVGIVDGLIMSFQPDGQSSGSRQFDLFMEPKTHVVNGFEVPKPLIAHPAKAKFYYFPNPSVGNWYSGTEWEGDAVDFTRLERNIVFLNKEDAIANAKAMAGIDPYGEVNE